MTIGLDHIAIAVGDLGTARAAYETLLGRRASVEDGRARFQLSNMAFELVEAAGEERFSAIGLAVDDLDAAARILARRGITTHEAAGGLVADPDAAHGFAIALRARRPAAASAPTAEAGVVQALDHVVINTPNPDRAVGLYGARLGLDFRLDRSNPQWGSRLLFFRAGAAVIEVAARLDAAAGDGPDRLSGLAWRVAEPEAARERLAGAGLDVSEVRAGRKPGTHVFTVRSGVPGAPSLMLSADPALEEA
ncbi:MAG: VOC family protein [Caulobacteraceae bacterium]|nr:VOC family protein [Caulobacteraceae bacterium]